MVGTLIARGLIEAKDVENSRSHALQTTVCFKCIWNRKIEDFQQLKKMKKKWMISLVI